MFTGPLPTGWGSAGAFPQLSFLELAYLDVNGSFTLRLFFMQSVVPSVLTPLFQPQLKLILLIAASVKCRCTTSKRIVETSLQSFKAFRVQALPLLGAHVHVHACYNFDSIGIS